MPIALFSNMQKLSLTLFLVGIMTSPNIALARKFRHKHNPTKSEHTATVKIGQVVRASRATKRMVFTTAQGESPARRSNRNSESTVATAAQELDDEVPGAHVKKQ